MSQTPNIKMVDLSTQHNKIESALNNQINEVVKSGAYINGPAVKDFKKNLENYLNVKHVIPCANGTDALQVAILALGLEPGDEIIVPSFNYVAAAEAIAIVGIKPVFCDVNENTFALDLDDVKSKIGPKTKGIMAIHLFGQCAPMADIMTIAQQNDLYIIEDTAQSLGAKYTIDGVEKHAGTIGHVGTTSFFPTKNLGCMGDGGAIFTNDDKLAEKIAMIASHGQKERYSFECIGMNSRLDTIQAAILNVKLPSLDECIDNRRKAANYYFEALKDTEGIILPEVDPMGFHSYNQFTIRVLNGKRDELQEALKSKGIPSMIYYPKPLHLQKAYDYLGAKEGDFPVSERMCQEVLSIPVHPELTEKELTYISSTIRELLN